MNWKELLLNLGTPVIETMIAESLGDVVVFQKEDDEFIVIESSGLVPQKAVYTSEEEIREEFPGYDLVKVTESIYYLLKEIPENFDEIVRIESLSEKLRSVERLESRITRHVYQLEGMETIISSLLEPLPLDILLSMVVDAVGELFVASIALYHLTEDGFALVMSTGSKDFPEVIGRKELSDPMKFSGLIDSSEVVGEDGFIIPVSDGEINRFLVFIKRDDPLASEEKALLNAIFKILEKSREYIKSKQREMVTEALLNQMRFVMESIGEFASKSLALHEEKELMEMTVDMIREMLQSTWAAIYEDYGDGEAWLRSKVSVREVELPSSLRFDIDDVTKPGKVEGIDEYVWLAIPIKLKNGRKFLIFVGNPITEEFLNEEVKDLYIEIIVKIVKESFENMEYEAQIREREEKVRKLYEAITSIGEFVRELRKKGSAGEVYDLINEYAKDEVGIDGFEVEVGGMPLSIGETQGEKFEVDLEEGKFVFYKRDGFDERDKAVLKALAEGAMIALKEIYLLVPKEKVTEIDEMALRVLREKARKQGINEEDMRFYVLKGASPEKVEEIGVGLVRDEDVVIATDKEKKELEKMGYEVEEL